MNEGQHQSSEKKLHFIEQKIDLIREDQAQIKIDQKKLREYLLGDEADKTNVGALARIQILELRLLKYEKESDSRMLKLEKKVDKWIYIIITGSLLIGWGIGKFIDYLIHAK